MAQLNLANQENLSVETIDDLTIYSDGVSTVYVTHNENDDYVKIAVSRNNEDSYVWVHYEYANDSDNEKMDTLDNEYESYNVSGYDSLAYDDIIEKANAVFSGDSEFNTDCVITIDLDEKSDEHLHKYAEEHNLSMEDALRKLVTNYVMENEVD